MDDSEGSSPGAKAGIWFTYSVRCTGRFRLLLEFGTGCDVRRRVSLNITFKVKLG